MSKKGIVLIVVIILLIIIGGVAYFMSQNSNESGENTNTQENLSNSEETNNLNTSDETQVPEENNVENSTNFLISCLYNAITEYYSDSELMFKGEFR